MAKRDYVEIIKDNGKGDKISLTKTGEIIVERFSINSGTQIPTYPTISGFVNESYIKQQKEISLDILISNEDLVFSPTSKKTVGDPYKTKYLDLFEGLLLESEPILLYLGGVSYDNLHLESYTYNEDNEFNLTISLTFKEVFFATTKKVKSKKVAKNNTKKQSATTKTSTSRSSGGGNTAGVSSGSKNNGSGEVKNKKEQKRSILRIISDFIGITK